MEVVAVADSVVQAVNLSLGDEWRVPHNLLNQTIEPLFIKLRRQSPEQQKQWTTDKLLKEIIALCSTKINNRFLFLAGELEWYIVRQKLPATVSDVVDRLPTISNEYSEWVHSNSPEIDSVVQSIRNNVTADPEVMPYSYFAAKTIQRVYCCRDNDGEVGECPEHIFLREAWCVTNDKSIQSVSATYRLLMTKMYTHASPTIFNAGTKIQQLSSCFLLDMQDSIDDIYQTIHRAAIISKTGGGLGINIQNIRNCGSKIRSGGTSNGVLPVCRNIMEMTQYVSQSSKRRGSCAVYYEAYNKDITKLNRMRLNNGVESERCRELFCAVVLPDIFFERLRQPGSMWTLFCTTDVPHLKDLYGQAFTDAYVLAESRSEELNGVKIKTHTLWNQICQSIIETGAPYLLSKSNIQKSPQSGLVDGQILKQSNLCVEIIEHCGPSPDGRHTAVCNLATLKLDRFVTEGSFDFHRFDTVVQKVVRNLNHTIDVTRYPDETTKRSNFSLRPLGCGLQGLADLFLQLDIPFDSPEARQLNFHIAEQLYYSALTASCELAQEEGAYPYFNRSRQAQGHLQFDYTCGAWGRVVNCGRLLWTPLKEKIMTYGLRNSLLIAFPPTASTAGMLGTHCEGIEPLYSNIYSRNVSSGQFVQFNPHLQRLLEHSGIFNNTIVQQIMKDGGSVKNVEGLSANDKAVYKTAFEMKMRPYLDLCADRQLFCDQSQSMNVFSANPTVNFLTSVALYGHKIGLKSLLYYCKTRPKVEIRQFSLGLEGGSSASVGGGTKDHQDHQDHQDRECLMCGS
jgi:ribonucleoside-diphosphate reductase subunit M1